VVKALGCCRCLPESSTSNYIESDPPQPSFWCFSLSPPDHTLVVTTDGQIVGWGRGREGQLGVEASPLTVQPMVISGKTRLPAGQSLLDPIFGGVSLLRDFEIAVPRSSPCSR
jgi:hypothetical protein